MKTHFDTLIDKIDPRFFALNRNLEMMLHRLQSLNPENVVFVLRDEIDFANPTDSLRIDLGRHPFCMIQIIKGRPPLQFKGDEMTLFCPRHSRALRHLGAFFQKISSKSPPKIVLSSSKALWFAKSLPQDALIAGCIQNTSPENGKLAELAQHLFVPSDSVANELLEDLELSLPRKNQPIISIVDFTSLDWANAFRIKAPMSDMPAVDHEICSYHQVAALRRRPELYRKLPQVDPGVNENRLLLTNGKKHAAIRRLIQPSLTPKAISLYADRIKAIATEATRSFALQPSKIVLEDLVSGYVDKSIASAFGISLEEIQRMRPIISKRIQRIKDNSPNVQLSDTLFFRKFYPIVEKWIHECPIEEPSVIGYIKKNHLQDPQSKYANYNNIITSLSAALGGTQHYLHQTLEYLQCHQAIWRELLDDPSQIDGFITDSLRFFSVTSKISLYVEQDFVHEGVQYKAGEHVRLNLDMANRDPSVFEKPNEINWKKNQTKHLAFGIGEHHCLGGWLVVMITKQLLLSMTCSSNWVWPQLTNESSKHSTTNSSCPFSTAKSGT